MLGRDPVARRIADALAPVWRGAEVLAVLGSGLGGAAASLETRAELDFGEVPGLGASSVPGHAGRVLRGTVAGAQVVLFQGRRHLYEGIPAAAAALPVRVGAALGARLLVSCSAVGGAEPSLPVGAWVLIEDHLNLMGRNPLEGVRDDAGPAFVDLTGVYRADLFDDVACRLSRRGTPPRRGILAAFVGPSYETPAEVRMARLLGASVVGMSTVPEAVWARYLGLDVLAWGRVANPAAGMAPGPIDHAEVLRQSELGASEAAAVLEESIRAWRAASNEPRPAALEPPAE